jgi:hypothetical protein
MLIVIGAIVLGIGILGGLFLMDSESVKKTVPVTEPKSLKQEKNASNNVKCSPNAFGSIVCSP